MYRVTAVLPCLLSVLIMVCLVVGVSQGYMYTAYEFRGNNVPGQNITTMKGEGGIVCGRSKFRCARSAVCINGECRCPLNTHGHPHLICVDDNTYITTIVADPVLLTFDRYRSHVPCACRYLLSEIISQHRMGRRGGKCYISIHAINHNIDGGYYVLGYDFQLRITDESKHSAQGELAHRVFGYGEDGGVFVYKTQGKESVTKRGHRLWKNPGKLQYLSTMVHTTYDTDANTVTTDMGDCGVKIVFRAKVKYSKQMPGILIEVKKDRQLEFPLDNYPLSGSPLNQGRAELLDEKHRLNLEKLEMTLYTTLIQNAKQDFGYKAIACNVAQREFTRICTTEAQRAFAIHTCAFFFTNPQVTSCLKDGEFGSSSGTSFAMCAVASCTDNADLCEDVKSELDQFDCQVPEPLNSLDCKRLKSTRELMYPPELEYREHFMGGGGGAARRRKDGPK